MIINKSLVLLIYSGSSRLKKGFRAYVDYVVANCATYNDDMLICFPSKSTVTGGLGRRNGVTDSKCQSIFSIV